MSFANPEPLAKNRGDFARGMAQLPFDCRSRHERKPCDIAQETPVDPPGMAVTGAYVKATVELDL